MAMAIGVGIWVVAMLAWGVLGLRRRARLKRNPPAMTAQQVWDEATPEERDEVTRQRGWSSVWNAGSGPSGG